MNLGTFPSRDVDAWRIGDHCKGPSFDNSRIRTPNPDRSLDLVGSAFYDLLITNSRGPIDINGSGVQCVGTAEFPVRSEGGKRVALSSNAHRIQGTRLILFCLERLTFYKYLNTVTPPRCKSYPWVHGVSNIHRNTYKNLAAGRR